MSAALLAVMCFAGLLFTIVGAYVCIGKKAIGIRAERAAGLVIGGSGIVLATSMVAVSLDATGFIYWAAVVLSVIAFLFMLYGAWLVLIKPGIFRFRC